ncbi:MAG: hypothetical protein Gyms2KO_03630 [Gymnodinialimonas sp.]
MSVAGDTRHRFEPVLDNALFVSMLNFTGPGNYYEIRTLEQIFRYDFQPSHVGLPNVFWQVSQEDAVLNACENAWTNSSIPVLGFYRDSYDVQFNRGGYHQSGFPSGEPGWETVFSRGMYENGCHMRMREFIVEEQRYAGGPYLDVVLYSDSNRLQASIMPLHSFISPHYDFSGWSQTIE